MIQQKYSERVMPATLRGLRDPEPSTEKKELTLFHQLGGYALIESAVELFHEKILIDVRANYFFGSNDTKMQRAQMKSFLTKVLGVSALYGNFEMDSDPSPFIKNGMTNNHIVIVMNHLRQSFLDLGVNTNVVDETMVCIVPSGK